MHYSKETPSCSTFRVITINFGVAEILGFLQYILWPIAYLIPHLLESMKRSCQTIGNITLSGINIRDNTPPFRSLHDTMLMNVTLVLWRGGKRTLFIYIPFGFKIFQIMSGS